MQTTINENWGQKLGIKQKWYMEVLEVGKDKVKWCNYN